MSLTTPTILLQGGMTETFIQILYVLLPIPYYVGLYVAFKKAEVPGWKAIIPLYNWYMMLKIGGEDWKWILAIVVPVVNIYAIYKYHASFAKAFGQGVGFGLLGFALPMVYAPLLAFGDYQYQGNPQRP